MQNKFENIDIAIASWTWTVFLGGVDTWFDDGQKKCEGLGLDLSGLVLINEPWHVGFKIGKGMGRCREKSMHRPCT